LFKIKKHKIEMKKLLFLILVMTIACQNPNTNSNTTSGKSQPIKSDNYNYDVEGKIKELGIVLTEPSKPVANYVNAVTSGNLVFLAGKGPNKPEGGYVTGKIPSQLSVEEGYQAARLTGIAQLSALKGHLGDLNKVKRIVKVVGMVNADADFTEHPEVINGFSDLMVEVFGERGKHARAAVGMTSLPRDIACEIEMIVEVE